MQPVSCHHAQDPFAQGLGPYTEIPVPPDLRRALLDELSEATEWQGSMPASPRLPTAELQPTPHATDHRDQPAEERRR